KSVVWGSRSSGSRSICVIFSYLYFATHISGVRLSSVSAGFALRSSCPKSILKTAICPCLTAKERGIRPYPLSAALGLTYFRSKRITTTSSCQFAAAYKSGVRLPVSAIFGLTSFRSKRIFNTAGCPCQASHKSGV
ncbi:hypothetical protein L873DRAFT_1928324, partial [Choiromyces venosus 120613-1]